MGLFSKKELVCERCGKPYEVRVTLGAHLCPECREILDQKRTSVKGYLNYASAYGWPEYTEEEMDAIIQHRNEILSGRLLNTPSLEQMVNDLKYFRDKELDDKILELSICSLYSLPGIFFGKHFLISSLYGGVVVNVRDVYAAGYETVRKATTSNGEQVLVGVLLTKDPYIPVLPFFLSGRQEMFRMVTKSGRDHLGWILSCVCPNLVAPVMSLGKLSKAIKRAEVPAPGGRMGVKEVRDTLLSASVASGPYKFNYSNIDRDDNHVLSLTLAVKCGYYPDTTVYGQMKQSHIRKKIRRAYSACYGQFLGFPTDLLDEAMAGADEGDSEDE